MADEEDKCTMERLQDGDDLALNDIMARWKEPLITFCYRYTGNPTDAREIAQETFVKVYQSRHRYKPVKGVKFSTWLFRIAANLCRMRHRWKSRHPEVFEADREKLLETQRSQAESSDDPRHSLDLKTLSADLDAAIRMLPSDLRTAFILQEVQGTSQADIAAIQNCTVKSVERRLARARATLRNLLQEKWRSS